MTFDEYQKLARGTATTSDVEVYVLGLLGEAGSIASAVKKAKRDTPARHQALAELREELGDVLWYLAELASRHEVSLDVVAKENLKKTEYLFNSGQEIDFDHGFPPGQRFPEKFTVDFIDDGRSLRLLLDGNQFGDSLTDNAYEDDGYRYHDIFHIAYAAMLGWSPVLRKLWKIKRKEQEVVDEVEDGARAAVLEEGISILVFSQSPPDASGNCLFSDSGSIPFWILENIKKMTRDLEVSSRSVDDWRRAISRGFGVFEELRRQGGGRVVCDLKARTIELAAQSA